ncbi:MAG: hypothetical protein HWE25_07070 [Alphaproteobacteria bacterium]|nr:hypothetical protein [Alphaproteobacteria bacterium]
MLETIIKLISEQALTSRPAFERPITHLKYGIAGALVAAITAGGGLLALGFCLYLGLLDVGLTPVAALGFVGVGLLVIAALSWAYFGWLTNRELVRQRNEETQKTAQAAAEQKAPGLVLQDFAMEIAVEVGRSFVEGMKSRPEAADVPPSHVPEEPSDPADKTR